MRYIVVLFVFCMSSASSFSQLQSWENLQDSTEYYKKSGDIPKALMWAKLALLQGSRSLAKTNGDYLSLIGTMSVLFRDLGQLDSAIYYGDMHLSIDRILYKTDNKKLANSINYTAVLYSEIGDFSKAELLLNEALDMYRRLYKGDHPDLASGIGNMASLYHSKGDNQHAELLFQEAVNMDRRLFKNGNTNLVTSVSNFANFYSDIGEYQQAEPLVKESLELAKVIYLKDHPSYATIINNTAYFYRNRGDLVLSDSLFQEAYEMRKRIYRESHPDLIQSTLELALMYKREGDFQKAEPLYREALTLSRKFYKGDHSKLSGVMSMVAVFYTQTGDYEYAGTLLNEAIQMCKRLSQDDSQTLATTLNNVANYYEIIKDYHRAETSFVAALEMTKRLYKGDHRNISTSLNNLAVYYNNRHEYSKSEILYLESLEMDKRLFIGDNPTIASTMNNLGSLYDELGNHAKAEPLLRESLEMTKRLFKGNHPDKANGLMNLASFYKNHQEFSKAKPLYVELMNICKGLLTNYFPSLSEKEKEQYYSTLSSYYRDFNNFAVKASTENPELLETMFDAQLLTKGMLLNASSRVRRNIQLSDDKELKRLYSYWLDKKEYIAKLYQLTAKELQAKNIKLDSVVDSANKLEKELTKRSAIFSKEAQSSTITWKNIQQHLNPNDAVIEIVRISSYSSGPDSIIYAALILKPQGSITLKLLPNGKDLEGKFLVNYTHSIRTKTQDTTSYSQFWEPFTAVLKGVQSVYVSPDGIYNKINLSTILNPNTQKYLFDEAEIILIGSSRDIVSEHSSNNVQISNSKVIELFGDPTYYIDSTHHRQITKPYVATSRIVLSERSILDTLSTRGTIQPLPGTKAEVEQIASIARAHNWEVRKHVGDEAMEEAVKSVESPYILHIATHGQFIQDVEVRNINSRTYGMSTKRFVENPLLRSMLLLTGAENTITQRGTSRMYEDGLFSAYEAMNLNLTSTELVVLSACETGLGTIKNGEGVYGLQRSFLQAGAKSIIMSLWSVNDETTQQLMTEFYNNWTSGQTKRMAFHTAQQTIKAKYPEPYYWGAFVMVGE